MFGKIKAAVADIGGAISHAAIVAREYGMPAVAGLGDAAAYDHLPPERRPHLRLRGVNELLEILTSPR